jgi:hypothetical protein
MAPVARQIEKRMKLEFKHDQRNSSNPL